MTTKEILLKAREILATPGKWCRGHYAVDSIGSMRGVDSPEACQLCALGAVAKVAGWRTAFDNALVKLTEAMQAKHLGSNIPVFNDRCKTVEPVLELYDKAIALCE